MISTRNAANVFLMMLMLKLMLVLLLHLSVMMAPVAGERVLHGEAETDEGRVAGGGGSESALAEDD